MRALVVAVIVTLLLTGQALAVPDTIGVRITDVTPASFCLVWMTDVAASPSVEIFADAGMNTRLDDQVSILPIGVPGERLRRLRVANGGRDH